MINCCLRCSTMDPDPLSLYFNIFEKGLTMPPLLDLNCTEELGIYQMTCSKITLNSSRSFCLFLWTATYNRFAARICPGLASRWNSAAPRFLLSVWGHLIEYQTSAIKLGGGDESVDAVVRLCSNDALVAMAPL